MDYLTRLIAGAGSSPTKQRPNTSAERLVTCTKVCNALQHLWRNSSIGPEDDASLRRATDLLGRLNVLLHDEARKAAPHSCLLHVASSQIYIIITKLALSSQNSTVTKAAAQIFHILIDGEAEGLLDSKLFSRALLDLVRYSVVVPRKVVDEQTEADLIELLFEVTTKIRLDPDLLPAWFFPERERSRARNAEGETRRNQFPLFYVLVHYVHYDGPVGDFARTGLLYLTETASKSKPLETWMIESDLAPQMASGLGALYSRLSRNFPSLDEKEKALPVLAFSDLTIDEDSSNESKDEFREDMRHFLSYLAFWQDTLNHCSSIEVKDTLLDHFQVLFVQQLLYPSLLESSDVAGGSTAAVMAHLARMLVAMDNTQLVERMLPYLLASKAATPKQRPRLSTSRRRSMDHLAALAEAANSPSPNLFNLLDLVNMSLKSQHINTVNTCLRLLSVIVSKHHSSVLLELFRIEHTASTLIDRRVKTFNDTLIRLFDFAANAAIEDTMDNSYQATLTDTKIRLEHHSCSMQHVNPDPTDASKLMTISPGCKLLDSMLTLFENFFANDTMTNLLLTEVFVTLAACKHICLQGWLLQSPRNEQTDTPQNVITVLDTLVRKIQEWQKQFSQWDRLTAKRRKDLAEDDEPMSSPDARSMSDPNKEMISTSPSRPGNISPQLSRPVTPRSRPTSGEFGSITGTLSPSPTPKPRALPRAIPGSPLRHSHTATPVPAVANLEPIVPELSCSAEAALETRIPLSPNQESTSATSSSSSLSLLAIKLQERTITGSTRDIAVSDTDSGAITPVMRNGKNHVRSDVSLSHILTNAIILQEFILEVAATVQVRVTLFAEVDLN